MRKLVLTAALSAVLLATAALAPVAQARVREYWVAAVPTTWNVVPNGHDPMTGETFEPSQTVIHTVTYRRFTPHWRRMLRNGPTNQAGGGAIPGPLIRARIGDTILVHFKNMDTLRREPHSMHFHGVHYAASSDGAFIPNGFSGPGARVEPGHTFTYRLFAGLDSVGVWPYHDHSPSMMESIEGGMYGALSIYARHDPIPDREFVVYFEMTDGFMTIDGRAFLGNTPVFHAKVGDRVQWDVLALGSDFHTFHVHGHRWRGPGGRPQDVQTVGPADSFRFRWIEDRPGPWLYHCHVEDHMERGMIGLYRVKGRSRK
jgi:FtsP/CotA-like multicopper oxidase with cupredoxin domain